MAAIEKAVLRAPEEPAFRSNLAVAVEMLSAMALAPPPVSDGQDIAGGATRAVAETEVLAREPGAPTDEAAEPARDVGDGMLVDVEPVEADAEDSTLEVVAVAPADASDDAADDVSEAEAEPVRDVSDDMPLDAETVEADSEDYTLEVVAVAPADAADDVSDDVSEAEAEPVRDVSDDMPLDAETVETDSEDYALGVVVDASDDAADDVSEAEAEPVRDADDGMPLDAEPVEVDSEDYTLEVVAVAPADASDDVSEAEAEPARDVSDDMLDAELVDADSEDYALEVVVVASDDAAGDVSEAEAEPVRDADDGMPLDAEPVDADAEDYTFEVAAVAPADASVDAADDVSAAEAERADVGDGVDAAASDTLPLTGSLAGTPELTPDAGDGVPGEAELVFESTWTDATETSASIEDDAWTHADDQTDVSTAWEPEDAVAVIDTDMSAESTSGPSLGELAAHAEFAAGDDVASAAEATPDLLPASDLQAYLLTAADGADYVQVGAYESRQRADALAQRLQHLTEIPVAVGEVEDGRAHRVRIGPLYVDEVPPLAAALEDNGFGGIRTGATYAELAGPPSVVVGDDGAEYLQVGAFGDVAAADVLAAQLRDLTEETVSVTAWTTDDGMVVHRVRIGPLDAARTAALAEFVGRATPP